MFEEVNISNNEKLNKVVNNFKLAELETNLKLNYSIAEPGVEFILEEPVAILTFDNKTIECTMYLLNSEIIISRKVKNEEKFIVSVPIKQGGTIM